MKIFVSYSHRDSDFAEILYTNLKSWGHETWIDHQGIPLASYWTREIDEALEWADVTVGLMTPNAIRSENVQNEWFWTMRYEEEKNKRLILLKQGDFSVPHYVIRRNWLDLEEHGQQSCFDMLQERLNEPHENIARYSTPAATDPYRDYLQTLYQELEDELDFLVLSIERMMDIAATDSPDKVQQARKKVEKPRMLRAFSRRNNKESEDTPIDNFKAGFDAYEGRLLLLGDPGAGKTITLLTHARDAILARLQDPSQPLPLLGRIATWDASTQTPLHEWLTEYTPFDSETIHSEIESGNCLLLLDGLDELGQHRTEKDENDRQISYDPRQRFIEQIPKSNQVLITCRVTDYQQIGEKIPLNGSITLSILSDKQVHTYLSATPETSELWEAIKDDADLLDVARIPLLLSLFAFAFRDLPEETRKLKDLSEGELRDAIFEQYIQRRYAHEEIQFQLRGENPPFSLTHFMDLIGWMAGAYLTDTPRFGLPDLGERNTLIKFLNFAKRLHIFKSGYRFLHLLIRDSCASLYSLRCVKNTSLSIQNRLENLEVLEDLGGSHIASKLAQFMQENTNDDLSKSISYTLEVIEVEDKREIKNNIKG